MRQIEQIKGHQVTQQCEDRWRGDSHKFRLVTSRESGSDIFWHCVLIGAVCFFAFESARRFLNW